VTVKFVDASIAALSIYATFLAPTRMQSPAETHSEVFAPVTNVSFTISVARPTFTTRDAIPVHYKIVNVGKAALYVPRGFDATGCLEPGRRPHIDAWFEDGAGRLITPGYGASCGSAPGAPPLTLVEWMKLGASLLKPGEAADGVVQLHAMMGGGLHPGPYRIHASLRGWTGEEFTSMDLASARQNGTGILRGEIAANPLNVRLTAQ
jgi:hypothetical protein